MQIPLKTNVNNDLNGLWIESSIEFLTIREWLILPCVLITDNIIANPTVHCLKTKVQQPVLHALSYL